MARIRRVVQRGIMLCVGFAPTVGLAVAVAGCGNPGEGTGKVDPAVRARLGKPGGIALAAYKEKAVEPIGGKPRPRKQATRK
jgi:hypothetical protein